MVKKNVFFKKTSRKSWQLPFVYRLEKIDYVIIIAAMPSIHYLSSIKSGFVNVGRKVHRETQLQHLVTEQRMHFFVQQGGTSPRIFEVVRDRARGLISVLYWKVFNGNTKH